MKNSKKHSKYGILSLLTFLLLLLFLTYLFYSDLSRLNDIGTEPVGNRRQIAYIQTCMIFAISIVGTVFGTLGIVEQNKRKLIAIIGLILNGLISAGYVITTLWVFIHLSN